MEVRISIADDDLEFVDRYATEHCVDSRSGVIQRAVELLRATESVDEYAAAWDAWADSDADAWETTAGDGVV